MNGPNALCRVELMEHRQDLGLVFHHKRVVIHAPMKRIQQYKLVTWVPVQVDNQCATCYMDIFMYTPLVSNAKYLIVTTTTTIASTSTTTATAVPTTASSSKQTIRMI